MRKNKKYDLAFKLRVVKEHLEGESIKKLAGRRSLSTSLLRRWIDHYQSLGEQGLLPRVHGYHSSEFKLKVVKGYLDEGLSLRACCLEYGIANESTVLSWVRKYELSGLNGLREQRGRPMIMKDKIPPKKTQPLTRLEELEKENLYLRAENELLKKLEALTQAKETQKKKR